ncbi:MAG: LCP family protein [Streptosporangiaceae bacterium]|jgi:LCP family protein required for cell wall assembly
MTGWQLLRRAGYGVVCVVAALLLLASSYLRGTVDKIQSIGSSNAIASGPSIGAQNILLMGLESRTDYEGNILPADLLAAMHAGSVQGVAGGVGGQATNTLILIHIFANGTSAVGFSIPRDDWVTFPQAYDGQSAGKIDQAYGLAYAQSLNSTVSSSLSHTQRYFLANEAGQSATIQTVEALTGVQVDHFAEVNLAGFYELAKAFGGIWVCVKSWNGGQNLHDANSGFRLSSPGYHHLWADQALAFVRERDNLPNGDLDRTHRQQAVIDYVIWRLRNEGILSSFGQLNVLLNVAKKYVITDAGWQLIDFASQMRTLTGKNLTFRTLPVVTTAGRIDGQDVNIIDPAAIQEVVQQTFYPSAQPAASASPSASVATPEPSPSSSPVTSGNGGSGGPVTVPDNASYGIPCVY